MKINKPKVISLFSGCGGMDLGFTRAGFDMAWANDNFLDAVETYRNNIGHEITSEGIEEIDLSTIPDADVVIGGFPCQGFSVANMNRKVDDDRNILYQYFVKIVDLKKPKFFVAENVKGILNIGGGEVIQRIVKDFADVGYEVRYKLFNVADYGVPQSRERVIIFGVRNDIDADIEFPPKPTHNKVPFGNLKKHVSIGEALKIFPHPDEPNDFKNHIYTKYKPKFNGYISNRKVDPDRPSPTVTARGDGKGGAMIINHPHQLRRLSCRELATLQGFPLDFEFSGSMTSIYRQIGNAVPPQFAEHIAGVIGKAIKKGLKKKKVVSNRKVAQEQTTLFV
jgi:DNA (cytosine-5)-methyltransferase 1